MKLLSGVKSSFKIDWPLLKAKVFGKVPPDYFGYFGSVMTFGAMGSGKGLSVNFYTLNMMKRYPRALVVTNDYNFNPGAYNLNNSVMYYNDIVELHKLLMTIKNQERNNGDYPGFTRDPYPLGVIVLVDEIKKHSNEFGEEWFAVMGLLRKLGAIIIYQTQVYKRANLQTREQLSEIWRVMNIFGILQVIIAYDASTIEIDKMSEAAEGERNMRMKFSGLKFFFHSYKLYESYNSFSPLNEIQPISFKKKELDDYYDFIQAADVEDFLIYSDGNRLDNYYSKIYTPLKERNFESTHKRDTP